MSATDAMILVLIGLYGAIMGIWLAFSIISMVEAYDRDDFKEALIMALLTPVWPIGGIIILVNTWRGLR